MKVTILANERNEEGQAIGGVFKTIYEAEENVNLKLQPLPYRMWRMEITRNGTLWQKAYLSESQLTKLRHKLKAKDSCGIICPSDTPLPGPLGSMSNVFLESTDSGKLEVVRTPEWHRCIFDMGYDELESARSKHEST